MKLIKKNSNKKTKKQITYCIKIKLNKTRGSREALAACRLLSTVRSPHKDTFAYFWRYKDIHRCF